MYIVISWHIIAKIVFKLKNQDWDD